MKTVPVGSVDTGGGGSDGGTDVTYYLLGGALVAAGAGAGITRRLRRNS